MTVGESAPVQLDETSTATTKSNGKRRRETEQPSKELHPLLPAPVAVPEPLDPSMPPPYIPVVNTTFTFKDGTKKFDMKVHTSSESHKPPEKKPHGDRRRWLEADAKCVMEMRARDASWEEIQAALPNKRTNIDTIKQFHRRMVRNNTDDPE